MWTALGTEPDTLRYSLNIPTKYDEVCSHSTREKTEPLLDQLHKKQGKEGELEPRTFWLLTVPSTVIKSCSNQELQREVSGFKVLHLGARVCSSLLQLKDLPSCSPKASVSLWVLGTTRFRPPRTQQLRATSSKWHKTQTPHCWTDRHPQACLRKLPPSGPWTRTEPTGSLCTQQLLLCGGPSLPAAITLVP